MNYHIVFIPLIPDHLDWTQDVMQQILKLLKIECNTLVLTVCGKMLRLDLF